MPILWSIPCLYRLAWGRVGRFDLICGALRYMKAWIAPNLGLSVYTIDNSARLEDGCRSFISDLCISIQTLPISPAALRTNSMLWPNSWTMNCWIVGNVKTPERSLCFSRIWGAPKHLLEFQSFLKAPKRLLGFGNFWRILKPWKSKTFGELQNKSWDSQFGKNLQNNTWNS